MKKFLLTVLVMVLAFTQLDVQAQNKSKVKEITIKSSVVCGMCRDRVEEALAFKKGVKDISVDIPKQEITVSFKPKKITENEIKKAIVAVGYDADKLEADPKAYTALPACCKKGNAPH